MTERSGPAPSPTTLPGLSGRAGRVEMHDLAARMLVSALLLISVLLLVSSGLQELAGVDVSASRWRLLYASGLLFAAGIGAAVRRRGRPRLASALSLQAALLACAMQAWNTGLGIHSLAISGSVLLVVLAGVLASPRAAVLLAVLDMLLTLGLFAGERAGLIPGALALPGSGPGVRLVGLLLLLGCGLIAALVVARLFGRSLGRALAQEQRLDQLLHIGSDWVWEMNAQGRLTYIAPAFALRTGRSVAEFMHVNEPGGPQVVRDAEYEQLLLDMQQRVAYRERVVTFRCADGTALSVRGSGQPRFDAQGEFCGWWGTSRNVTAERQAEQERRRSQAMLDRLVRLSPDAINVARLSDGVILLANPGFLHYTGLRESQVIGRSALQLGLWRSAHEPQRLAAALQVDGAVRNLRSVVWLGDEPRDMLLTAAAFEWDGEPVAVITSRDVTDTERARIEGDAILDNASVGIALVRERRFERVNPQFETMFNLAPGSLAGQSTGVLFPDPVQYDAFAARSDRAQRAGKTIDIERSLQRADGSLMQLRLRARPVDIARPRESGSIWVVEDITERRRSERELADAKQQAEAANEAKSAFLATMSHEIRTPLNGVLGLARLLQDSGLDERRRREYQGHLVDAAELLTGIVSDVLDLSKIEAGHLEIEDIAFDLHGVVSSTFHTFAPLGRERGLLMRCSVAPDVPHRVRGDPVRVRQILANYLTNALKFTQRGEIALQVSRGSGGRLRLEVHDTGPGIAADVRARLFQPFAQADSSTTRRFGGTGLGLSICRELATRMGGEVGVESDGGSDGASGSCFWAELVLPAEAPASGGGGRGVQPAPALPLAGLAVLVAEDNLVNMLIVGAMLRRLGAEVLEADDGAKAIAQVQDHATRLGAVLMDLHMPVVDGLSATRRLRADPLTAHVPVFAFTAAVLEHERAEASAAGMNGFVAKPVIEADLLRALRPLAAGGADD